MSFLDGRTPASFRSPNHGILPNTETEISDASAIVGSVDPADQILIRDVSAGDDVTATVEQVRAYIPDYSLIPAVDGANDQLLIYDDSAGAMRRVTVADVAGAGGGLDIPSYPALATVDAANDLIAVYDASGAQNTKATIEQVRGEITDYGAIPAVDPSADQLLIADASAADAKQRGTIEAVTNINNYTTIGAAIDAANDQLLVYDASAGANRKVAVDQLPASGASFDPLDPIEIGTSSTGLAGTNSVMIGANIVQAGADAVNSVLLGNASEANGTSNAVIVGYLANSAGSACNNSVIIGHNATSVDLGVTGREVCIGAESQSKQESVAIGYNAYANGTAHVVIGDDAVSNGSTGAIAIGQNASVAGASVSVGWDSVSNTSGTAVGVRADAPGFGAVSLGLDSDANGSRAICIGGDSFAEAEGCISIGYGNRTRGLRDVAIGYLSGNTTGTTAGYNVSIGARCANGITTSAANNVFIGRDAGFSVTNATDCICIGYIADCSASGTGIVTIGDNLTNSNDNTVLIGSNGVPLMRLQVPGTVTQATNNTTPVTLNATQGEITMFGTLAGTTQAIFTVNNTFVKAGTLIFATAEADQSCSVSVNAVAAGSFSFVIYNNTASATTAAPIIHFTMLNAN